jgi:hypothetical protein
MACMPPFGNDALMRPPFQVDQAWYEAHWLAQKAARIDLLARVASAIRSAGRLAFAAIIGTRRSTQPAQTFQAS